MSLVFPSLAFFEGLKRLMHEEEERFRRLGFMDTTFGVAIAGPEGKEWRFVLAFEVFECQGVWEVRDFSETSVDFILEGELSTWQEMLSNIREHGQADVSHSLNTLTHFGEKLRVLYEDPDDRDKFFRFQESIQEFFDLAAKLDFSLEPQPSKGREAHDLLEHHRFF